MAGVHRVSFRTRFAIPFVAGLPGILALVLYIYLTTDPTVVPEELSLELLAALSAITPLFLLAVACSIGAYCAHRVGLYSYLSAGLASGDPVWRRLREELRLAVGLGLLGSTVIVVLDLALAPFLSQDLPAVVSAQNPTLVDVLVFVPVRFLYGGVTEELLLRFGLMSALAFGGWYVTGRQGVRPSALVMWVAILVSAVLFGVGHLPALAQTTTLTPLLIGRTVLLNAIGGVVFGWLYWRHSLEAAMVSHMTFHVPLVVLSVVQVTLV